MPISYSPFSPCPCSLKAKSQCANKSDAYKDEVLACNYGWRDSCKQALYFHLKDGYSISKQGIPYRIEEFAIAIERIFGPGAKLIEIEIMKALFAMVQDFKCAAKQEDLSFTDYVKTLSSFS